MFFNLQTPNFMVLVVWIWDFGSNL
jgi:hypothetical protein